MTTAQRNLVLVNGVGLIVMRTAFRIGGFGNLALQTIRGSVTAPVSRAGYHSPVLFYG